MLKQKVEDPCDVGVGSEMHREEESVDLKTKIGVFVIKLRK